MKRLNIVVIMVALLITLMAGIAQATPLAPDPDSPDLDLEGEGLSVATGGIGLKDLGTGTKAVSIS